MIARALGVSVEYLVTGVEPSSLPPGFLAVCRELEAAWRFGPVEILAHGLAADLAQEKKSASGS